MITPRSIRYRSVLVDTSAFYALLDRTDGRHSDAVRVFERLARERWLLYTSNLIVAETHALVLRRLGREPARAWLGSLDVNLVLVGGAHHEDVCALLDRYEDKDFSYTDAASFVLMEELGVATAFAFDDHFRQYGWEVLA